MGDGRTISGASFIETREWLAGCGRIGKGSGGVNLILNRSETLPSETFGRLFAFGQPSPD
jgi:hypothetical protein